MIKHTLDSLRKVEVSITSLAKLGVYGRRQLTVNLGLRCTRKDLPQSLVFGRIPMDLGHRSGAVAKGGQWWHSYYLNLREEDQQSLPWVWAPSQTPYTLAGACR